jgi:hypothetical protein
VLSPKPGQDWRCGFCVEAADWGGGLRKRLRIQRLLIAAGAMYWPERSAS